MHRITTFGGVEVRDRSGELRTFRSRKHVALLVFLRSSPRRVHLRERLIDLFWETESSLARHSLSQALYDLRSTLGQVVVNCPGDAVRIEADRLDYDVEDLERAVKGGELPEAVDLYTAPFAPDLDRAGTREFEQWLERERSRLSVLGQSALRQFLDFADHRGEWGEMCSAALRLIRLNPLDEAAHRALMRGLWLHGDQASALEHFSEVRERLEYELQDGISQQTLDLVERIEGSRPGTFQSGGAVDRTPPLVGRQAELEVLGEFADREPTASETLLIQGEAGIGKTRLVQELEKLLTLDGFTLLKSQCYAAEAEVAYGPVLDGLREVMDGLADLPGHAEYLELGRLFPAVSPSVGTSAEIPADGQSARRRLFEEIADVLRRYCQQRKVVWVVEDVHCIDGASSALFHYLARRLAGEPFRLVLTTRPESEQNDAARSLLDEEFFVETSEVLKVGPLEPGPVEELVQAINEGEPVDSSIVDRITKLSGGNPFYAVELAKILLTSSPTVNSAQFFKGKLRAVLRARLQGLPFEALQVLESVAVLGTHAQPSLISDICALNWQQLSVVVEELRSRGILCEKNKCLSFTHEITREFVYENIGLVSRSALHQKAAELLAGNPKISPSTVARHFQTGGDSSRAFEYAIKAVRIARSRDAFSEAREMADLSLNTAVSSDQKFQALQAQVEATRLNGQLEDTLEALRTIVSSLSPAHDSNRWVNYSFSLMEVLLDLSSWDAAFEYAEQVKNGIQLLSSSQLKELATLRLKGAELSLAIRSKEDQNIDQIATKLSQQLEKVSNTLPTEVVVGANYSLAGYTAFYKSAQEATDHLTNILNIEDDLSLEHRIKTQLFLGALYIKLADWDKAEFNLSSALKLTKSVHDVVNESAALNNMGCLHLALGEWIEAERFFRRAVELQEISTDSSLSTKLHSDVNLANTYFFKGQPRRAFRKYQECLSFSEDRELESFKPEIIACIGLTALQCSKWEEAGSCTRQLARLSDQRLRGIQERYKIDWLLYYMQKKANGKPSMSLRNVANDLMATDIVSSLKLQWLEVLIDGGSDKVAEVREELRNKRLHWFIGFAGRWFRSTEASAEDRNLSRLDRPSAVRSNNTGLT